MLLLTRKRSSTNLSMMFPRFLSPKLRSLSKLNHPHPLRPHLLLNPLRRRKNLSPKKRKLKKLLKLLSRRSPLPSLRHLPKKTNLKLREAKQLRRRRKATDPEEKTGRDPTKEKAATRETERRASRNTSQETESANRTTSPSTRRSRLKVSKGREAAVHRPLHQARRPVSSRRRR